MRGLLEGKSALVTGAAKGIGYAITEEFLRHGCSVLMCDADEPALKKSAEGLINVHGNAVRWLKSDVRRGKDAEEAVALAAEVFGKLDILVNNAGVLKHALVTEMKEEDWDFVFDVNVKGSFLFSQCAARRMMGQKSGCIINMSSCSAKKPSFKEGAYCASKAAILGLNRVLALELGPYDIRVNAILPGATDTEMVRSTFITSPEVEREWIEKTVLKRLGTPKNQADVAVFLASDLASHITGEALVVSAGEMMSQ